MIVVFTITEVNYLMVDLFNHLVRPLSYLLHICGIKFIGCTVRFVSGIAKKAALLFPTSFTIF